MPQNPLPPNWRILRLRILRRDDYLCQACFGLASEVDHIVPRWKQGGHDESNLQALCADCHRKKTLADRRPRARY